MKKCPSCQKTFDDNNLKFCQTDGTPLVAVAEEVEIDPYKTVVGNQSSISEIIAEQDKKEEPKIVEEEADLFQTMIAPPPTPVSPTPPPISEEEDILDVPDDDGEDMMKTMIIHGNTSNNIKVDIPEAKPEDSTSYDLTAESPFENKQESSFESSTPEPPKFNEPNVDLPNLEDVSSKPDFAEFNQPTFPIPQFESTSDVEKPGGVSDKKSASIPIASPFDKSMPPGYAPPLTPPFEPPKEPLIPQALNEPKAEPPKSPFAEPGIDSVGGQADDWSPPSAPVSEWENKEIGQNTPFDTPPTAEGQNMTLAYVSLATGILSMTICCLGGIVVGPIGIVTGYMARGKAKENPTEYGGEKFALIGMITGAVGIVFWLILLIINIFTSALAGLF